MKNYAINNDELTIFGTEKVIYDTDFSDVRMKYEKTLRKLIIEEGVHEINRCIFHEDDKGFFAGYENLQEVVFPESLQYIGSSSFINCKNLTEITLPESLEPLAHFAFKNTPWRERNIEKVNGCFYLGRFLVDSDKDIVSADIREGTTAICDWAFKDRMNLTHINIPDTVRSIGSQAFLGCQKLEELCIYGNSLEEIKDSAFTGCTNLKRIEIPNSCTSINRNTFVSSTGKKIFYPQIAFIPHVPFDTCHAIEKEFFAWCYITSSDRYSASERELYDAYIRKHKALFLTRLVDQQNTEALQAHAQNLLSEKNIDEMIDYTVQKNYVVVTAFLMEWKKCNVKESKKSATLMAGLEKNAFSATELKKSWNTKKLPDGTLCITSYKGSETEIVVPAQIGKTSVTCIGRGVCSPYSQRAVTEKQQAVNSKISTVIILDGIKEIEPFAFLGCGELTRLEIPASVCKIAGCFTDCKKLTIYAPAGSYAERYAKENGIRFSALKE